MRALIATFVLLGICGCFDFKGISSPPPIPEKTGKDAEPLDDGDSQMPSDPGSSGPGGGTGDPSSSGGPTGGDPSSSGGPPGGPGGPSGSGDPSNYGSGGAPNGP